MDPAAGTGALPPIGEEAKPRKYEHMPRRVAVGVLLGIMATKDCTVDEVDALSLGINALVRRCRHSAKNWARRREREDEKGEDNGGDE